MPRRRIPQRDPINEPIRLARDMATQHLAGLRNQTPNKVGELDKPLPPMTIEEIQRLVGKT